MTAGGPRACPTRALAGFVRLGLRRDHFRSIIDGLPTLVSFMTPEGELAFANRQLLEYSGATFEELKAAPSGSAIHPDDRAGALGAWRQSIETGPSVRDFEGPPPPCRWGLSLVPHARLPIARARRGASSFGHSCKLMPTMPQAGGGSAGRREALARNGGAGPIACRRPRCIVCPACRDHGRRVLLQHRVGRSERDATGTRSRAKPSGQLHPLRSLAGWSASRRAHPRWRLCLHEQVLDVTDLRTETRWVESGWCQMALAHGLLACWAIPILSTSNNILGAFAVYYDKPGAPTSLDRSLVEHFVHVASIVGERVQSDAAPRRSEARKAAILDSCSTVL